MPFADGRYPVLVLILEFNHAAYPKGELQLQPMDRNHMYKLVGKTFIDHEENDVMYQITDIARARWQARYSNNVVQVLQLQCSIISSRATSSRVGIRVPNCKRNSIQKEGE